MKLKNNHGSITIFVLVQVVFMTAFLVLSYSNILNKSKIAQEQKNIISGIYSHNDTDGDAYNRAYTALRNENRGVLSASVSYNTTLTLTKTFEDKLSNYRIYGNASNNVGTWNSSEEKYEIQLQVSNESGGSQIYSIYLYSQLTSNTEYIDFKNQKFVKSDGTQIAVTLPEITTYEDYTKIEILESGTPSKIEVDYIGYKF